MRDLPKKYSFCLNPDPDYKVSKCPFCRKATFKRKFPLVIHIDKVTGLLNLGFTCKYCAKCECIIADKSGLETELTLSLKNETHPVLVMNIWCLVLQTRAIGVNKLNNLTHKMASFFKSRLSKICTI